MYKKILTIVLATFGICVTTMMTPACAIIDTGNNKEAVEVLATAAASQAVYSSLVKEPELEDTYLKIIEVLKGIDVTVDMAPEDIAALVQERLSEVVKGDYQFIINGVVDALFTKYNIGWKESLDKVMIHSYIENIIVAIEVAIEEYHIKNGVVFIHGVKFELVGS